MTTIVVAYGIGVAILLVALVVDAIVRGRTVDNWLPAPFPVAPAAVARPEYAVMDRPGRRRLEMMCDRIEACLAGAKIPARMWGGELAADAIRLRLTTTLPLRETARLAEEIALSLDVPVVNIEMENSCSGWIVIPVRWRGAL